MTHFVQCIAELRGDDESPRHETGQLYRRLLRERDWRRRARAL